MGKPDVGNPQVRFDEGEGHGLAGPSLLDCNPWLFFHFESLMLNHDGLELVK